MIQCDHRFPYVRVAEPQGESVLFDSVSAELHIQHSKVAKLPFVAARA
jgi:hypothetical protein